MSSVAACCVPWQLQVVSMQAPACCCWLMSDRQPLPMPDGAWLCVCWACSSSRHQLYDAPVYAEQCESFLIDTAVFVCAGGRPTVAAAGSCSRPRVATYMMALAFSHIFF
jgi:hypothetical protein